MSKKENPFKEKIKIEMVKQGFTQTKMAEKLGISNQAFSAWLSDCPNPKIKTLKKVASVLGKSSNYFFENSGNIIDENKGSININNTDNTRLTLLEKDMEIIKKEIEILKLKIKK